MIHFVINEVIAGVFQEDYLGKVGRVNRFIQKNLSSQKDAITVQISKISFLNSEKIAQENKLIKASKRVFLLSK